MTNAIEFSTPPVADDFTTTRASREPSVSLMGMRDEQLRHIYRAGLFLGVIALILSAWRNITFGWHPTFFLNLAALLTLLIVCRLEYRFSYHVRAIIILVLTVILGVVGLMTWGLMGMGFMALFVFCMLSALLFGLTAGIVATTFAAGAMALIGAGAHLGLIRFHFDAARLIVAPISWAQAISGLLLTVGIIVVALGRLNQQLVDMIQRLDSQNLRLQASNARLAAEIQERDRIEKERRVLEDRLQLARKMEALGVMSGSVAHDLNNVLMGVVGYPDLLLARIPEDSPVRKPVIAIKKSGLKAAAIVQDMLTLTRRGVVAGNVVNLNEVVVDFMSSPEMEKIQKFHPDIAVSYSLDKDLDNVKGSGFHLSRVVMNLVSNGAEAMPGGGALSIRTEKCVLEQPWAGFETVPTGRYAVLVVRDTGIGIQIEEMERIFEPFYTKKIMGRSGTGLGMAVVWNAVKDHDGFIDVRSSHGTGTAFYVYFPVTTEAPKEAHTRSPLEYMGKGESVLVVDDVPEMRDIACHMIVSLGYEVTSVPGGEAAVRHLSAYRADLVILDMLMDPGMDGLDTFKRIRDIRGDQKVLIVSGHAESERIEAAIALGAGGYLKKPFITVTLARAMRAVLDHAGTPIRVE